MIKKTLIVGGLILVVFIALSIASFIFRNNQRSVDNDINGNDQDNGSKEGRYLKEGERRDLIANFLKSRDDAKGGTSYKVAATTEWGDVLEFRFWEKGDLIRAETTARGVVKEVYLMNNESGIYYLYYPTENRAVDLRKEAIEGVVEHSLYHYIDLIIDKEATLLKKEDVENKRYSVLEIEAKRLWIEEDSGLLTLIEESSEWGEKTTRVSEFQFEDFPEHIFFLPAQVQTGTELIY